MALIQRRLDGSSVVVVLVQSDSYEVEIILDYKVVHRTHKHLIKWKGYGSEYNVWKTAHQL